MMNFRASIEAKVVKLADWLASGERRVRGENNQMESSSSREARLENIFDNLAEFGGFVDSGIELGSIEGGAGEGAGKRQKSYFPLSIIPPKNYDQFFPKKDRVDGKNDYDGLWKEFEEDLRLLGWSNVSFLDLPVATWVSLLRKYTSRIPSATPFRKGGYFPDISLFQHCKITSAIAVCLAHNLNSGVLIERDIEKLLIVLQDTDNNNSEDYPAVASFLGGDISGIQEYLYSIPTKGAAKQLKARSFLIQLLSDFVATYISEQLDLPPTNIIYSSGGRFYLLLPVLSEDVNEKLPQSKKAFEKELQRISKELLNYLKGDLHLICAYTDVKVHHFKVGRFSEIWREVTGEISRQKKNKYSIFFRSGVTGDNSGADQIKEIYNLLFGTKDSKEYPSYNSTAGAEEEKSEVTEDKIDMEEFGKKLRNVEIIVRRKVSGVKERNPALLEFVNSLGYDYDFHLDNLDNVVEIISVNGFELEKILDNKKVSELIRKKVLSIPLNFRFYANYWPTLDNLPEESQMKLTGGNTNAEQGLGKREKDSPIMFEDFAELSTGPKKIAIFRADVDSMGEVFTRGLGSDNTLSRSAMLSSAISEFFEGYVNHLAQDEQFRGYIGIVYSGGDDLFIVGSWDKVVDFALRLQEDFKCYSNYRLSISGGIVVVDATTPIRFVAKMAEDVEITAKNYKRCVPITEKSDRDKINSSREVKKDCIVLFDTPIGYEEKRELLKIKESLLKILENNGKWVSNKGILRKLQSIFANYMLQKRLISFRKARRKATTEHLTKEVELERWRWLLLYSLRKYLEQGNENEKEIVENLENLLLSSDLVKKRGYKIEDKVGAILRWVELLTREKA